MRFFPIVVLSVVALLASITPRLCAEGAEPKSLDGTWHCQSAEFDGKEVPAEAAQRLRFIFRGNELVIQGSFQSDKELECTIEIDPDKTPAHLTVHVKKDDAKRIWAIYERRDDELKICLRHESGSDKGRPEKFATEPESNLVLVTFKRQKP